MSDLFAKVRGWLTKHTLIADVLSSIGLLAYCLELWTFTHNQFSVLDEGLYLYKGWLFATGEYTPFQDYGPWTNQMPLAFLIPGWVERIFGPGLATGRTFAFVLGILTLVALWLTTRRPLWGSNHWIAAGVVAALALNPAAARMVSMAASQGLVACLLAWMMFFALGEGRKNWQLALAGLLAGTAVMTRINLAPVLPLLLLYVWWTYGWRAALWTLAGELLVFGGVHALYWPGILKAWARWLPLPFLQTWMPPPNIPTWTPDNPLGFRIASFFLVFRFHFAALTGALASWVFWPKEWKSRTHFKAAVFISVLLVVLFVLHGWAALGNEYCVFCFPTYTAFYSGLGLLLLALTIPSWQPQPPIWRRWLGFLSMLALLVGIGYSAEGTVANLLGADFYKNLLALPAPGFSGALIWQVLVNKLRVEYENVYDAVHVWFPMIAAGAFGLLLLSAAKLFHGKKNSAAFGVILFLFLGTLFSPSVLLAGEYNSYDCPQDVLPGYARVGKRLAQVIPAGSSVYWVGYSPVTLLALPDVKIYPAQLHGSYSFRISDDDDALLKYGWWNQHLAEKWLGEADFVLIEGRNISRNNWLTVALQSGAYRQVAVTGPQAACQDDSFFTVFRRK